MSGVVRRCPNCGTTQAGEGQCDACHEAEVRFFCLNHDPGLWLSSVACPDCGARFGDPLPSRIEMPPRVGRAPPRPVAPPSPRRVDPEPDLGPWAVEPTTASEADERRPATPDPFSILIGALTAAARARAARSDHARYADAAPVRRRGGGCIGRIFVMILVLLALLLMAPFFLGALLGFR